MNISITGGLGFVGRHLCHSLLAQGHQVTAIGSTANPALIDHPRFRYLAADTTRPGRWQQSVAESEAIVNLAGRSIFKRWDERYKRSLYDSRVLTTRHLSEAIPDHGKTVFLSTSAVGYYGNRGEALLVESEPAARDFLGTLSRDWEAATQPAEQKGARVVIMRFGIVLGKGGGAFAMMDTAFKMFVGGPLGPGTQWFPWIHISDLVEAVQFLLDQKKCAGPFNVTAPEPIRNRDMAITIGRILNRPSSLPAPAFMMKMVLGEMADALLSSTRAIPQRLQQSGFSFRFPDFESALLDLENG